MNRRITGRGALSNRPSRYQAVVTVAEPPEPLAAGEAAPPEHRPETEIRIDPTRTIIARNASPDVPFSQSINPYRGCEHGCIYCYARPTHAYLGMSPGLDFETKIIA